MTLRELHRHREAVIAFHNAYSEYLDAGPRGDPELRAAVQALVPAAERGLSVACMETVLYPPPMFGGPVLRGLTNMIFQHETTGAYRETPGWILDACRVAGATLEGRMDTLRRQRKNPIWWIDRFLRAVLGIPAYLISLILRTSYVRIDSSAFGVVLRLISAAGAIAGIYFGGNQAGWW